MRNESETKMTTRSEGNESATTASLVTNTGSHFLGDAFKPATLAAGAL